VGELNGSNSPDNNNNNNDNNNSIAANSGVSFGENHVRTFETDSSERINEYMSPDADADGDDDGDGDDGRLKIGGDIKLDMLDIHTLNDTQNINAPPLLDDIEVLA
jgi:hypothetical protein